MRPRSAVVLVGGPAVYAGHALAERPRILLPVGEHPLLSYLAINLREAGVERLIVCHTPSTEEYRKGLERALAEIPVKLDVILRETMLGTGGSVKQVSDLLRGEPFWVIGGDSYMRADLSEMLSVHRSAGGLATLAAVRLQTPPWQMERVEANEQMSVRTIHRMHPAEEKRSTLRPITLYLFEPAALDLIPPNSYYDLKEQLFAQLHETGRPAAVWVVPEHARTLVSVDEYFAANQDFLLGRVKFPELALSAALAKKPEQDFIGPVALRNGARIGSNALVVGPAVLEECEIGAGSVLVESVVLRGARIGRGAQINHCLVGEDAVVEDGVVLRDMIVPRKGRISAKIAQATPGERQTRTFAPSLLWIDLDAPGRTAYRLIKRAIDILFALTALFLLSPILLLIAIIVMLDSPGAAFYTQTRCGRNGRPFPMVKFRTMVSNADDLKRELQELNEVDGPTFKLTADPRVTRIGKILRDTNLDEVPQLINVLNGEMSLIGPRPLSMDEMCYNPVWRDARLAFTPGLTGPWQVEAHSKALFSEWIRYDLFYVQNASGSLDTRIFLRSLTRFASDVFDFLWMKKKRKF
ncbi:MAG: sugar transferase [Desulfobacteraceae bacterium]|nr:sugar transferase [Desulfobacteraceae bacterium]